MNALLFLVVMLLGVTSAALLGGKKFLDLTNLSDESNAAAQFAATEVEGTATGVSVNIIRGSSQVVSGNLFDFDLAVTGPAGVCRVFHVKVGSQAWRTPQFKLYDHTLSDQPCPPPTIKTT